MFNFDNTFFDKLLNSADESERRRAHHCLHKDHSESVQRLCIGLKNGTYVRPHCHTHDGAWEMIFVLKGKVALTIFDDEGYVAKQIEMLPGAECAGVELTPGTWHTIVPVDSEAVIFEVKEGPFSAEKLSIFAEWSPEEGSGEVNDFLKWMQSATVGDKYSC